MTILFEHRPNDRTRVSLENWYDVQFWVMEFDCTEQQLRDAVSEHGDSVEAVRKALKKTPDSTIMEWD